MALGEVPLGTPRVEHVWPAVLPDGDTVLFTISRWVPDLGPAGMQGEESQIAVLSLDTGEQKVLIEGGSYPRYSPTGHLLYGAEGALWAVGFNLTRLETVGNAVRVQEGVVTKGSRGATDVDISAEGTLVYVAGSDYEERRPPVWVTRDGQEVPTLFPARQYVELSLSPDGTRAAFQINDAGNRDVWVSELERGTLVRLTSDPAVDPAPVWSPDGTRIAFASNRTGAWDVRLRAPDGTGDATVLTTFDHDVGLVVPWGWSPDGATLIVQVENESSDIGTIPGDGSGAWEPFLYSEAHEVQPAISPDGQWIAYTSDETGDWEVYLQRYPGLGDRRLVSVGGGISPVWSPDGRELFYNRFSDPYAMMRVTVDRPGDDPSALTIGTPELLFDHRSRTQRNSHNHVLSPDGQRFLMFTGRLREYPPFQVVLVQNWHEELKRLVPVD